MPAFTAAAPGKIILFGEHAVVYGRPAIAVPVPGVQARAVFAPDPPAPPGQVTIEAPAVGLKAALAELPGDHPLRAAIELALAELGVLRLPACKLRVTSTIPVAAGLGSGAAVTVAVLRACAAFLGRPMADARVSALAYEVEKLHHGTPSGVDNTVVTYAMPVYFVRRPEGSLIETFSVPQPFTLVIGDSGIASPTGAVVGDLRRRWQANPARYEPLFDRIGHISQEARRLIEAGRPGELGPLMDENQRILQEMDISSPELDQLVAAARAAGALGAKLSGGGRGGNMIALVEPGQAPQVAAALMQAGAVRTYINEVRPTGAGRAAGAVHP